MLPLAGKKKERLLVSPRSAPTRKKHKYDLGGNKIHFISLGCPRNLVDSEVMIGILLKNGYELSSQLEEADYIVVNTCGFLEASREESLQVIGESLQAKKEGAKVIAAGCMVQTHSDPLKEKFPDIHYLLGSGDVENILAAVRSDDEGTAVTSAKSYLEAGEIPRFISTPRHYAYLKIAEGCRKRCAYCIIPTIKGPLKSKSKEQILKEFQLLLNQGAKEIILIAQDLGDYGKDQGFKKVDGLMDLLTELMKEQKPFWLRLLYLYPDEITPQLIQFIKDHPRICPYLDMPIQHVNNQILKSMHRATSKEQIIQTIASLRKELPEVFIRTSLIVGFPGETEAHFEELCLFLEEHPLDNVGIFKFSREPGSAAYDLPEQIPEEIKQRRLDTLMEIQKKQVDKKSQSYIGCTIQVIVEGYHPETKLLMVGRHSGQAPEIDGQVIINDGRKVTEFGAFYEVKITEVSGYDLVGKVLRIVR